MATLDPIPLNAPIAEQGGYLTADYIRWFQALTSSVQASPAVFSAKINLSTQNAAIGTTNIPLPSLSAGNYQVSTYARITTTDGVSSSLTVKIAWTEGAIPLSFSGVAMTGDTTSTVQSNVYMLAVDGATPIAYSTTYASNTANKMKYELRVIVQGLQ